MIDTEFSDRVKTWGITDQKSSGRCWLFTGLNVLRAAAADKHGLGNFQFSQNYNFFYDQLEKANLFLQAVIDTRDKAFDDREVDWLFSNPISDGGTFTGVANLVMKYGVVPANVMPESLSANNTSAMATQLKTLLRRDGLKLRETPAGVKAKDLPAYLEQQKTAMLKDVYHVLALCLGVPPTEFEWKGKTYTPQSFYKELLGYDLEHNYVMLMNDPCREYGKVYEIQYDRHLYDGQNWLYVNLPIERIKEMAIASIKAKDLPAFLEKQKTEMLKEVYHVLALCLGVPPTEFEWKGKTYTPQSFYQELLGYDLENNYVMLMNDPCREYGKVYEIQYDRHLYDGQNWLYVNLPIERIKEMAIASIKANKAMYFSCDVNKFLDRSKGVADLNNFDYESLLGVNLSMDKRERVMTHASGSSHAMTLIAVDLKDGVPQKWMVENSWGAASGFQGNIIMTDEWFNEYMFRLVVEKQFVPADVMKMLDQKPILLPAWDPMFLGEE